MWEGLFGRRNFYTKCKSGMKMTGMRMEMIRKRRSAMLKFLRNDVADLLRSNLDYNAYGRAEGVWVEMNMSCCYDLIQGYCATVEDKLKEMHKERECPEDCRVAVASLVYAAARFADLPELRDLRNIFTEKYGSSLDTYTSKELVEKLRSNPPTKEMKIKLMKDIAKEFSIPWNPSSLEQRLTVSNSASQQIRSTRQYQHNRYRAMSDEAPVETKQDKEAARSRPRSVRSRLVRRSEDEEGKEDSDQEADLDRLLRHYSMKPWRKHGADISGSLSILSSSSSCSSKDEETEEGRRPLYGKSASLFANHLHPKMPDYDELASRVEALRNK